MTRLSQSKHPAYHLRPNKAVDRLLFLELLRTLELHGSKLPDTYVGLGGPFLEDFRLLSQEFPQMELVCVERDEETHKRQLFHLCSSRMVCVHGPLGDYIATSFPSDKPVAIWMDYTEMRRESLSELADIVRKAVPGSLIRVTVRAETPIYDLGVSRKRCPPRVPSAKRAEFERLRDLYRTDMAVDEAAFRAEWFHWRSFSPEEFPQLLARMIRAAAEASCSRPKAFLPLHTVKYSDGTIMLSKTGLICREEERDSLALHFQEHCHYCSADPDAMDEIDVPILTTKERLHLEGILPSKQANGEACLGKLGYLIEGDTEEEASRRKMEQYERYYRLYPYFGKVVP